MDAPLTRYSVMRLDDRFQRIDMTLLGPRLEGTVSAFHLPPPTPQPGFTDIAGLLPPEALIGRRVLIVGGSRGLGEATAKLVASAGGHPIITYHRGRADAERVVGDIRSGGGACELMQLDVTGYDDAAHARLFCSPTPPDSVYFFATPKIFNRRHGTFDRALLQEFLTVYVDAFGALLERLESTQSRISVFMPSSVAVEERPREMIEYASAKLVAELMAERYANVRCGPRILIRRLPRIHTDQTATLLLAPAAEAVETMLPIVREMHGLN